MENLSRRYFVIALVAGVILFGAEDAAAASKSKRQPGSSPTFSYYLLVLSYAPDFCAQPSGKKDPRECGTGQRDGFVVHGLWPQSDTSRGPEYCSPASPVSQEIVRTMLRYIPTQSLIQHEWSTHGTCSALSAADYFASIRKARDSINLPPDLNQPHQKEQWTPDEIEAKLAAANPRFPRAAFRTSCYRDGELQEVRICLNKDLSPRACGPSAGECRAAQILLLPLQ